MKKVLSNLALGGIALLIALVAAEVVARFYLGYQNRVMRERNQGNILTRPPVFEDLYAPIEPGGFTNRANFTAEWWGTSVRTDSLGCRIGPPAPDSSRRILFIGDSMIFGTGLSDSLTIPALLQKAVNERYPERPAQVINAGVPGYDFRQYIHQTQRLNAALHPSLILIGICNNDLYPTEDPFGTIFASRGGKPIEAPAGSLKNRGDPVRRAAAMCRDRLKSCAFYALWQQFRSRLMLLTASRDKYDPLLKESANAAASTVDEFLAVLQRLDLPYGFVFQPQLNQLGRESDNVFYQLLKARHQPVLDLCLTPGLTDAGYFAKAAAGGRIHPEMHFNARGSRIVAEEIADWLITQGWWTEQPVTR